MKGLIAGILIDKRIGDCSNGGISSKFDCVTIIGMGADSEIFEVESDRPAVRLIFRRIGNETVVHAEPVESVTAGNVGYMAGGAYITTSDSRLSRFLRNHGVSGYMAVPLHDRQETPR